MNCEQIEPWISAYQDDELDVWRRRLVREHLACCPDCRLLLQEWEALEQELRAGLTRSDPPATLHARVMRGIPEREPSPARAGRAGFWRPKQWLAFALAPAAAAGLLLVQPLIHPAKPAVHQTLLVEGPLTASFTPYRTVRSPLREPAAVTGEHGTAGTASAHKALRRVQRAPTSLPAHREGPPRRDQTATELHRQMRQLRRHRWRYPVAEAFHRESMPRRRRRWELQASRPAAPAAPSQATPLAPLPRITVVDYVLPQVEPPVVESGAEYVIRPADVAPADDSGVAL